MVKNGSRFKTPKILIGLVWLAGLMPIFLVLLIYHLILTWDVMLILVEVCILATFIISLLLPSNRKNNTLLLAAGAVLVAINSVFVFDMWSEIVFTSVCGTDYFAGNCFLADGLEKFWYFLLFPPMLIAANILFSLNIAQKYKR